MRKTIRAILRLTQALLLLLALAALVLWPVSQNRIMYVNARRCIVTPQYGEGYWYEILCWDGRLCVSASRLHFAAGLIPEYILKGARDHGERLQWDRNQYRRGWEPNQWYSRWGPIQWSVYAPTEKGFYHQYAAPLWLVAPVFGAWPAVSIARAVRRRVKRRRAALEGCCKRCGYDLRATPEKGGGLLAVCPECGSEANPVS